MRIGEEAQAVAWCKARYGQDGSRFMEGGLGELVAADQAVLADEAFASALMITMGEAFRQGVGGYAQDIVVQGRPWGLTLAPSARPCGSFTVRPTPWSRSPTPATRPE